MPEQNDLSITHSSLVKVMTLTPEESRSDTTRGRNSSLYVKTEGKVKMGIRQHRSNLGSESKRNVEIQTDQVAPLQSPATHSSLERE